MKSTPIIFSGPMVRAILAGRKTQTRRIVRNQPFESEHRKGEWLRSCGRNTWASNLRCEETYKHGSSIILGSREYFEPFEDWMMEVCPYGVGDELWARESIVWSAGEKLHRYAADNAVVPDLGSLKPRSCPSIHMPRWASRITLPVTERHIEPLLNISDADGIAESAASEASFLDLWNSIHGDGASLRNPFVWALTFTVKENRVSDFAKPMTAGGTR